MAESIIILAIKYALTYGLTAYYNAKFVLWLLWLFLWKRDTKCCEVTRRSEPPECMQDPDLGDHRYVNVNGIRLHYVEKGNRTKPLMLLVHGFPECWYSWRHQLREFSANFWVVAVDLRGYNESERPRGRKNYEIDLLVSDIRELVRELEKSKFTFVAHDWGAVIGWHYLNKHMDTVDRYIFMDGPSREVMGVLFKTSLKQFRMSWYIFFLLCPHIPEFAFTMYDLYVMNLMQENPEFLTNDDLEAFKYVFAERRAFTAPMDYYRVNILVSETVPPSPENCAPGLYLLGENDPYICKESGSLLQMYYKNLQFKVVENAQHFIQQNEPVKVNRAMWEFLSS